MKDSKMTPAKPAHSPLPWHLPDPPSLSAPILDAVDEPIVSARNPRDREFIIQSVNLFAEARFIIQQFMGMLPTNRDWLDPDIERMATAFLAKLEVKP